MARFRSQMHVRQLSQAEWEELFKERCFNPPGVQDVGTEAAFEKEFQHAFSHVEDFLRREFHEVPAGESHAFCLHPYWNWSRFLDVEVTSNRFLAKDVVERLQSCLRELQSEWMICVQSGNMLFVTPKEVLAFLPASDDIDDVDLSWVPPFVG